MRLLLVVAAALIGSGCPPADPIPYGTSRKNSTTDRETPPTSDPTSLATPTLLSGNQPLLKQRIEAAVDQVRQRDLSLSNGFWTVFHGILGLGPGLKLKHPQLGIRVGAVDYICQGGKLRGMRFIPTEYGLDVETGELFVSQGHQDQFIAEMAQCGIAPDRDFVVEGKHYRFLDFVRHSQMRASVKANQELSWTIVVVGQYLGTDIAWTNGRGERLTFEDLVRYEVSANVEQAACGGTHRLFGLKWVYNLHARNGGAMTGVWEDLMLEQSKYQRIARKYQNPDGSFSTEVFRGPADAGDMQLRMNTTGHVVEWLAYSLPDAELREEWVERAVNRLALMILEIRDQSMESGSLYHAVHGLRIYYDRVFGEGLGEQKPFLVLAPDSATPKQGKK
jgi:hypothetical protein